MSVSKNKDTNKTDNTVEDFISDQKEIVLYQSDGRDVPVSVVYDDETFWLSQADMAQLFDRDVSTISRHISNVFDEGELDVVANLQKMQISMSIRPTTLYSLDVVISVGYRVNSRRATKFRQWATKTLKEYIIKGFVLDDERMKNLGGGTYWKELLDRIRDIRSSEKVFYRQVLDLYATSVDYDPHSEEAIKFFKIVQNKLHYAVHGHTAAELIFERASADKPFMGLKTFDGKMPTKKDIGNAKNYLNEDELKILNNFVSGYFDFAEVQAMKHNPMYMKDYIEHLDKILSSMGEKVLNSAGSISHSKALEKADAEYRKYQNRTLSPVEKEYLAAIKTVGKEAKENSR